MKEINEGNQIIYEAAGEEANIIFGLVQKEEMNEYVSYTVIATGFNSPNGINHTPLTSSTAEETDTAEKDVPTGFDIGKFKVDDDTDLEVPTFMRIQQAKKSAAQDPVTQTGFNFKEDVSDKDDIEEDDSSSFLRMMMD